MVRLQLCEVFFFSFLMILKFALLSLVPGQLEYICHQLDLGSPGRFDMPMQED